MRVTPTEISDVILLEPEVFQDARGYFFEAFNKRKLQDIGIPYEFVQDNISYSKRNVLRGLHYQVEHPQGKLVRVLEGTVFDVAVDLREGRSSFGKWVGKILSSENHRALWIPPGFAHGFLVLSEEALFSYKTTDYYAPGLERTIAWNDPELAIKWPISATPCVSQKDSAGSAFAIADHYGETDSQLKT